MSTDVISSSSSTAIEIITKNLQSYYSHEVKITFTDPSPTAMQALCHELINSGLLQNRWYHISIFSAIMLENIRLSSLGLYDTEANHSRTNRVFPLSSTVNPALTAALLHAENLYPPSATSDLLGHFVVKSLRNQEHGNTGVENRNSNNGTDTTREALLVRRKITICGWAALLTAGIILSVLTGGIVGYAADDFNAGATTAGGLVAIVALLETFWIWASKHKFL